MPCQDVMRLDRLPCNQQPALHSTSPLLFPKVQKTSVYIVLIMMMLMMMMVVVVMVIVMVMMMMMMKYDDGDDDDDDAYDDVSLSSRDYDLIPISSERARMDSQEAHRRKL